MPDSIEVLVNEKPVQVLGGTSVSELLQQVRLVSPALAVEVNRCLVPRLEHATFQLQAGDEIEIVTLVGGG